MEVAYEELQEYSRKLEELPTNEQILACTYIRGLRDAQRIREHEKQGENNKAAG